MISKQTLQNLYYQMLRVRMIEETIAERYSEQEMRCPTHLCIGQEAIATGVCANLKTKDIVFSGHRSHGHYLAKGGDLKGMIAELYGKVTGCAKGRGGSQHLVDLTVNFLGAVPIVAQTIPIAVGTSLATKIKSVRRITVVFFGEAAMEEGVTHESLNFAALHRLPILFVCENNLYSVYTNLDLRQPDREVFKLAEAHGLKTTNGDGNNVIEVYNCARKAIEYIREGEGPYFLEFSTYRHREHCGPNFDPPGFRPRGEFKKFLKKDPIRVMERFLKEKNILKDKELERLKNQIGQEIEEAFEFAKLSPFPDEELSEKMVYA